MAIPTTTIFFEDYFGAAEPLLSYDEGYWDPADSRPFTDDRFATMRGLGPSGEDCLRWYAPSQNCPGCDFECGTPDANCRYSRQAARLLNSGGLNVWRHLRVWFRPHGLWDTNDTSPLCGFLINNPSGVIGANPWSYFDAIVLENGDVSIAHAGFLHAPTVTVPGSGFDEWTCVELARRLTSGDGNAGDVKAWVNGILVLADSWSHNAVSGFKNSLGFYVGPWSGGPMGSDKWIDFARVAWADGPIGCPTRGGTPPDEPPPDPDAKFCRDDDYETECILKGECGRVMFKTGGLTREDAGWETLGNGFPSEQSAWFSWTAPRNGRFIWRTRGSEVFNEISIHRHTGALPPPGLPGGFAEDDQWDPTASTSSAIEVTVEEGVEYRIRVASASDGWIVVDWGPAKPLVQDDGWSVPEEGRATLSRVEAIGPASGFAVQDSQVASNSSGAGTEPTLGQVKFGDIVV